jgi:hypothetical protein
MKEVLDKFKDLIKSLESEHGQFLVFALFLRVEPFETWDLIISADWLSPSEMNSYRLIASKLQEVLTESESLQFSRIVLLKPDDPTIKFLLDLETVKNGAYKEFSGEALTEKFKFTIKRAYLLRSLKQAS